VGGHRQSKRSESQGGGSNISAPARFLDEADRDDLDRLRGFDYRQISSGFSQAERLWARIKSRSVVDLIRIDDQIDSDALELFWRRKDKTWGVVDCSSLIVMEIVGCRQAFAYDGHFIEASRQFGFTVVK